MWLKSKQEDLSPRPSCELSASLLFAAISWKRNHVALHDGPECWAANRGRRYRVRSTRLRCFPFPGFCTQRQGRLFFGDAVLVIVVGPDNPLHEVVAHDVAFVKMDRTPDLQPVLKTSTASTNPLRRAFGKSIWVMSPVMTAFELNPRRVTNIFICSEVVFCASSRMTNESFRVRPAHKGDRRNLDHVLFEIAIDLLRIEHVI